MDTIFVFFIISGLVLLILIVLNIILFSFSSKSNKKIDILLENGNIKDFKDIFLNQNTKSKEFDQKLSEAFLKIQDLESANQKTIQKTGVVRFNPFNDLGGNQSFVIALLDARNNGFVISSLFIKEGNRVYAKQVKNGQSEHLLSKEEIEAIERAKNAKN